MRSSSTGEQAQGAFFQALISLYKAMGGGWIVARENTIALDKNEQ